jgi:hypothetical protein
VPQNRYYWQLVFQNIDKRRNKLKVLQCPKFATMQRKRWLPLATLLVLALLLLFIKRMQRGKNTSPERIEINIQNAEQAINRNAKISYSKHARCRMQCRYIDEDEVREILQQGEINVKRIQSDNRGLTYPLEGVTRDKQRVRIVFAPKGQSEVLVVTCIDLDTDWPCSACE